MSGTTTTLTAQQARQQLHEIVRQGVPFDEKAHEALELGKQYLGVDNGHLTRIDQETDHWEIVVTTDTTDGQPSPDVQHNDTEMPEVTVAVEEQSDSVEVRVADNGPGVPDEQKEQIFGKGEKGLENAGTGIGLYLVKTLVKGYGGDVWVKDNDPTGAVFVVELLKVNDGT